MLILFSYFLSGGKSASFPLVTIGLVVGVSVLGVMIAAMFVKMRKPKAPLSREIFKSNHEVSIKCEDKTLL